MPAIRSNGDAIARALAATKARVSDMTPATKRIGERLVGVAIRSIASSSSPSGEKYKPLADKTIDRRRRKGRGEGGLKPLIGDTNQMRAQLTSAASRNSVSFGSMAKSSKGFPYYMTHQFGSKSRNVDARPFFPVDEVAGKLVPMTGGRADAFFAEVKRIIKKYIKKGTI